MHYVGETLQKIGVNFNVTRRGAIRATLPGRASHLDRALAAHLDTVGAMVTRLKSNGRLAVAPVGTWSSRFAEGARVTVFSKQGPQRGTVLPLMASGHIFGDLINSQPIGWDQVEVRIDQLCPTRETLRQIGFSAGDYVAFDALPEFTPSGFICARHLDDKAGVAVLLTTAKAIIENNVELPVDCHLIFSIFEEVGSGASAAVYKDVAELVAIDHAPVGFQQNAIEDGVTICMMDQSGPFDYHLSRKLADLCRLNDIKYARDVYKHYRSDSASAIEAGNDTRTALIGFGVDASHGHERTHIHSLCALAQLIGCYLQSQPTFKRDKDELTSLKGFPHQPAREVIRIET